MGSHKLSLRRPGRRKDALYGILLGENSIGEVRRSGEQLVDRIVLLVSDPRTTRELSIIEPIATPVLRCLDDLAPYRVAMISAG